MTTRTRHATLTEGIMINELLKKHIEPVSPAVGDTPAMVKYKEGFTDERIAAIASENNNPPLSPRAVSSIRLKLFGSIKAPPASDSEIADLRDLIYAVDDAHTKLNDRYELLLANFNQLTALLATNRIVDCGKLLIQHPDGSIPGVARAASPPKAA